MVSHHYGENDTRNQHLAQFNHLVRKTCQLRNIKVLEVGPALCTGGFLPDAYTPDGVHLNSRGYLVWRSVMLPHMPPPCPAKTA